MNILRELRKFKRKSVRVKLVLLIVFSVMLIASAYAWWHLPQAEIGNMSATVETWDVEYEIDEEQVLEEEVVIAVDNFSPGMNPFEKSISIHNLGTTNTIIEYEVTSVKLFGEEVLDELQANGEIALAGNTVNLFVNNAEEKYPFNICYVIDKTYIEGQYVDDETTPESASRMTLYTSWEYEQGNDLLDTVIGQKAYDFYNDPNNNDEDVLQFTIKINSRRADL